MSEASVRTSVVSTEILRTTQRPASRPGAEISPLHVGDPDFATPDFISAALAEAVRAGYTHYAQPQGDPELRAALAADVSGRSGRPYRSEQVIITGGGSPAISAAILATVNPGDRVLVPSPTYSLYADSTRMARGVPELLPPGADGRVDLDLLTQRAVGARMVVLCQPGNPRGDIYRREELETIAAIAEDHDLLILSDEAYDHIVYGGAPFTSALEVEAMQDRLIYCQTFSKTFAMTGWRVGYVAAPSDLAPAVGLMNRTFTGPVNSAVQRAALAAVTSGSTWPAERLVDYERRRDLTLRALEGIPGVEFDAPAGAFYVFLRFPQEMTSAEFVTHALASGVGVRSGSEFGSAGEGFVRIAFCVEDIALQVGLERLRNALTTSVADAARADSAS